MAIQFVGGKSGQRQNASGSWTDSLTDLTGGLDTQPSEGDIVVVFVQYSRGVDYTGPMISGFTSRVDASSPNAHIEYKRMGATPDTSITFAGAGNNTSGVTWVIQVWRGVDATTPFDVADTTSGPSSATSIDPAAITPSTSGAVVLVAGFGKGGGNAFTTGYTQGGDLTDFRTTYQNETNNSSKIGVGYYAWTSGAFDPASWDATDTTSNYAVTLALRPKVTQDNGGTVSYVNAGVGAVTTSEVDNLSGSFSCTGGANNALIAFVSFMDNSSYDTDESKTTATYNGVSMTRIGWIAGSSHTNGQAVFLLMNPASGSNTVAVAFFKSDGSTVSTTRSSAIACVELSGVDATTPNGTAVSAQAKTQNVTATWVNSMVLTGVSQRYGSNTGPYTPNTDDTELIDSDSGGTGSYNDHTFYVGRTGNTDGSSAYAVGATSTNSGEPNVLSVEVLPAASGGVTGTGATTLGAVTASGAGVRTATGTGAVALGAATVTATGERSIPGAGAVTLGAVTLSGSGAVGSEITGAGAVTLGAAETAGAGERSITGSGALSLAALEAAGAGARSIPGAGAVTLGPAAVAASGSVSGVITGTGAATLPVATVSGAGVREAVGAGVVGLSPAALSGAGAVDGAITGSGGVILGAVTVAGIGLRSVTGTASVLLGAIEAAGAAERIIPGVGAVSIGPVVLSGAGAREIGGSGAVVLGAAVLSGAGMVGAMAWVAESTLAWDAATASLAWGTDAATLAWADHTAAFAWASDTASLEWAETTSFDWGQA